MAKVASRLLEEGEYAGILCSSYRTFPLPAAQYIAEKYHLPLVIDLRDIVEQYASNEYIAHNFRTFSWLDRKITETFRHKLLRDRNNALRKADQVTTISPWHVEKLQAYNPNTELVYNGYDPELFYPEQHRTSQFVIILSWIWVTVSVSLSMWWIVSRVKNYLNFPLLRLCGYRNRIWKSVQVPGFWQEVRIIPVFRMT